MRLKNDVDVLIKEVAACDALTAEEDFALTKAVQEKGTDCDEMKKLHEVYDRFVVNIAKQYLDKGFSLEELVEFGKTGMEKAAMNYDHSRGFKFIAFAVWWIRQEMLKAIESKKSLKEIVDDVFYGKKYLNVFAESDKSILMNLANEGDMHAACVLLDGMNRKVHSWTEKFLDEDTNEEVDILRSEYIDGTTFESDENEKKELMHKIVDSKASMTIEDLWEACRRLNDPDPLLFELLNRGEENAAAYFEDPTILQELANKGNKYAAEELGFLYDRGDEEKGIFVNPKKAEDLFNMAGKEYEYEPEEEDPNEADYFLRGSAQDLEPVKRLVNELTQRYGDVGNELGLYVPMEILMKTLVGSEYYAGNLLTMNTDAPDCIVLHAEANRMEPLLYALRQTFPTLDIEMQETEW